MKRKLIIHQLLNATSPNQINTVTGSLPSVDLPYILWAAFTNEILGVNDSQLPDLPISHTNAILSSPRIPNLPNRLSSKYLCTESKYRVSCPYDSWICPNNASFRPLSFTRYNSCSRCSHPWALPYTASRWPRGGPCVSRISVPSGMVSLHTSRIRGYWNAQFPYRGVIGDPYIVK